MTLRRGAFEAAVAPPEIRSTTVLLSGPGPVPLLSGPARVYGVLLHGVGAGTSTWRVPPFVHAQLSNTGRAGGVWSPASVPTAAPLLAFREDGPDRSSVSCTVLWAPITEDGTP